MKYSCIFAPLLIGLLFSTQAGPSGTPGATPQELARDAAPTDLDRAHEPEPDALPEGLSSSDWSSIRQAYEANRHAAVAVEGGLQARNPGQRWTTRFDGRGFETRPDHGQWTWGLDLVAYGFEGQELMVEGRVDASAEGGRVAYHWGDGLEEWYVNDRRGLEHGYTLCERPAGHQAGEEAGLLTFTLGVRGSLEPRVQEEGRGVRFLDGGGATVLTYSGLTVFDADGETLPARFECDGEGLQLRVDEHGARYPLTIDPIAQEAYLKASNTEADDSFGNSVSVSGDTVVVGAYNEGSNTTGVNGDQTNNNAFDSGAVYVFVRNGTTWSQQAYLKASNTNSDDSFGWSVSIFGDRLVVGAPSEASSSTGINGLQSFNNAVQSGAAYVFVRSGTIWSQEAYLKASNTELGDLFGWSVSVSGDTVVVGAPFEDSNATGVNGDQADNSTTLAGAAYVFVRSGTFGAWVQQAYLKASNSGDFDTFGWSVSVSGETVVIGASEESSNATGINGNQSDNSAGSSGAAYVFVRSGTIWSQEAYLKASNADVGDMFGESVSVTGDVTTRLVVGAYREDSNATGVNGDQTDNSAVNSGAAYVFERSGTTWSQEAYLKASNTGANDHFGEAVSAGYDRVVVGSPGEASNAVGVNGDQSNNSAGSSGAAYAFVRSGTAWVQQAYLKASNADAGDWFGLSVAVSVSGDTVVVGAAREDSNATGVNGDQTDNSAVPPALNSGAAYVILAPLTPSNDTCTVSLPIGLGMTLIDNSQAVTSGFNGSGGIGGGPCSFAITADLFYTFTAPMDGDYTVDTCGSSFDTLIAVHSGSDCFATCIADNDDSCALQSSVFLGGLLAGDEVLIQIGGFAGATGAGLLNIYPHLVATSYCEGSGCPCGNDGGASGCVNGTGFGSELSASGSSSILQDDLVLTAFSLPTNEFGLIYMGSTQINAPFGNGQRCAGGSIHRFNPPQNGGIFGEISLGPGIVNLSTTNFSAAGHITVGSVWNFQAWYRDPSGLCGGGFNTSNALAITFTP